MNLSMTPLLRSLWSSQRSETSAYSYMRSLIAEHMMQKYKLGDPTKSETNLGPVCSVASAERIKKQVQDASESCSEAPVP